MQDKNFYLLTIRGTLAPPTLEAARTAHNETAGNPQGVAAAKSLGDISHNVFVNTAAPAQGAGELLIMDVWNNLTGFNQFFSDPQVQQGGGLIFADRDPVLWRRADDCFRFSFFTPTGKNDRFIGLVRCKVTNRKKAVEMFDAASLKNVNKARAHGLMAHSLYFRLTQPNEPESMEMLGVDVWFDGAGMEKFYSDRSHLPPMQEFVDGAPIFSTWKQPPGQWVEW